MELSSEQFFHAVDWNAFAKSCESGADFMEAIDEASAEIEYLGSENYDAGRCIVEEIAPLMNQLPSEQYRSIVTFLSACYPHYMCDLVEDDEDWDLAIRDRDIPNDLADYVNFVMSPSTVKELATIWTKIDLEALQEWSVENNLESTEFFDVAGDFVEHFKSLGKFFEEASLQSLGIVSTNSF